MAALLELEPVKVTAARRAPPTKGKTAAPPEEEENDDGGSKEEDESLEGEEYDGALEEPDLYISESTQPYICKGYIQGES